MHAMQDYIIWLTQIKENVGNVLCNKLISSVSSVPNQ